MDLALPSAQTHRRSTAVTLLVAGLILALTIFTRFYILGDRPMSHDEINHVVPSYDLYQGRGYLHDPVTHGPMQFHLVALTYFIFGDSDFTSRIPSVLFSIATVAFVIWGFRRYFGTAGALAAGLLFAISPYMLFYGRYVRNESFVALFGVVMLYAIMRYRESGQNRFLYLLTAVVSLHFATKETAYIYIAQALIFLAFLFLERVLQAQWPNRRFYRPFIIVMLVTVLVAVAALAAVMGAPTGSESAPSEVARPEGAEATPAAAESAGITPLPMALVAVAALGLAAAGYLLVKGLTLANIRRERSFDLLILLGTLVLPLLAPFPVKLLGFNPLDYTSAGIVRTSIVVVILMAAAVLLGLWWRGKVWALNAVLFYAIFIVLYTTFFTNIRGIATGLVGSLGYWMEQQGVNRGEQPLYYYALLQVPMYEFLPALGSILAALVGIRYYRRHKKLWRPAEALAEDALLETAADQSMPGASEDPADEPAIETDQAMTAHRSTSPLVLLLFWSVTSLAAFTIAGEKMPWLTVHITLGMLLCSGWLVGYLVETTPWDEMTAQGRARPWIVLALAVAFLVSAAQVLAVGSRVFALAPADPTSGQVITQAVIALLFALGSGAGLVLLLASWSGSLITRGLAMVALAVLALLTARAGFRANYLNYQNGKEFLQYAHAPEAPKEVFEQIVEISRRVTGGLDIMVAYDNETRYPYWWYMRDFPNKLDYGESPTRTLREYPIITVGQGNAGKLEPVVAENYERFDMLRMVWPNQDYYKFKWDMIESEYLSDLQQVGLEAAPMTWGEYLLRVWTKVGEDLGDAEMRKALFDIWINRDYTRYARITARDTFSEGNWDPNNLMRLYIRKDIAAMLYPYGAQPSGAAVITDPYAEKVVKLSAAQVIGIQGSAEGQLLAPRQVAFAPDGSLYVADSRNHRIQHFAANGTLLGMFGSYANIADGDAPGGTFYEPWGVAVGPDGSVYVADTWNNRIQKFSADGQFIKMWGYFGQAEQPDAFWGPRALAVNSMGWLLVTDTGNKRIVIFDGDGNYVTQFGTAGFAAGQFDEPTGIAVDAQDNVYIADTWNQRVQVLSAQDGGLSYTPLAQWDIVAWSGQSLENKPFIAVDGEQRVFVTDPEANRVLVFNATGEFVFTFGDYGTGPEGFNIASGVSVAPDGSLWVSDAGNGRLMRFELPVP